MDLDEEPVPSGLTRLLLTDRLFKQACKVPISLQISRLLLAFFVKHRGPAYRSLHAHKAS